MTGEKQGGLCCLQARPCAGCEPWVCAWQQRGNWFTFSCGETREHGRVQDLFAFTSPSSHDRTSCSGFDSPHVLRSPPLIYNAFHSAFKQTVAFCISCSVPLDVVQQWIVLRAVLKSSRTRQSRLLNHYLLIHFTQPGVIMHGPVNGYLSMPRIYLIISRSGGKDKSTDCVHCEAFSAGGET